MKLINSQSYLKGEISHVKMTRATTCPPPPKIASSNQGVVMSTLSTCATNHRENTYTQAVSQTVLRLL